MPAYQRDPVEAIQYQEPTGDLIPLPTEGSKGQIEAERNGVRASRFAEDEGIAALREFVKGTKGATGKKVTLGKVASWGRSDWAISVDTLDGTQYLEPGDWLIRTGSSIRIVKEDKFAAEFKATS